MTAHPEQMLQRQVADYLSWALGAPTIWTAHPSGGGGEMRGKILKGMGLRPGWPDIEIIHEGRFYAIELKAKGGVVSDDQRTCHKAIRAAGGHVTTCWDFDAVRTVL